MIMYHTKNQPKLIEIYSHRGYAGLYPENTLLGYQESINLGVHSLDIDVAITKDKVIVASHDRFLNKDFTRDKNKNWLENNDLLIHELNYEDLQFYDVGSTNPESAYYSKFPNQKSAENIIIPSLEKIIELIKEHEKKNKKTHKIQIEIKTEPADSQEYVESFVDAIVKVLKDTSFTRYTELQSFDWRTLIYAKRILPGVYTSFITQQNDELDSFAEGWTAGYKLDEHKNSIPYLIAKVGGNIWCPDYKDLNAELIKEAHKYNIKVIPWTVDDEQSMSQLIDWNIDGIITNYPHLLKDLLSKKNT